MDLDATYKELNDYADDMPKAAWKMVEELFAEVRRLGGQSARNRAIEDAATIARSWISDGGRASDVGPEIAKIVLALKLDAAPLFSLEEIKAKFEQAGFAPLTWNELDDALQFQQEPKPYPTSDETRRAALNEATLAVSRMDLDGTVRAKLVAELAKLNSA